MHLLRKFIHHPRKLFVRRALFQIHLWAGVLFALYVVVIALTGSILVFENELTSATLPPHLNAYDPVHVATVPAVVQAFHASHPGARIEFLSTPSKTIPAFQLQATDADKRELTFVADPTTAEIHPRPRTWVNWVHDLHVYLLLNEAYGMQVNGVGAIVLLLLTLTGLVLWWPGIKSWTRGLQISFRHNWRRINFDAHSAIGFWTLSILLWWSFSGIYFAWYREVGAVVNFVSTIRGMKSPLMPSHTEGSARVSLETILAAAQSASPQGRLFSISDPSLSGTTVVAQMDLRAPGDFSHRDLVTIASTDGRVLSVWHYGENETIGDWMLWATHPFHFGTLWGLAFKMLWCLLGVSAALLTITGLLMYWNRYLRHQVRFGKGKTT